MDKELFWVEESVEESSESRHYVSGCWEDRSGDDC